MKILSGNCCIKAEIKTNIFEMKYLARGEWPFTYLSLHCLFLFDVVSNRRAYSSQAACCITCRMIPYLSTAIHPLLLKLTVHDTIVTCADLMLSYAGLLTSVFNMDIYSLNYVCALWCCSIHGLVWAVFLFVSCGCRHTSVASLTSHSMYHYVLLSIFISWNMIQWLNLVLYCITAHLSSW